MAYNWKYGTLSDRERMKRIRNGDTDVYNAEKEMNRILRQNRNEAGLSTDYVDGWDKAIDDAYLKAVTKQSTSGQRTPLNSTLATVNKAYSKAMKELREEKAEALEDATEQAESARENLYEWLANNGFSNEGSTSKEEKEKLEESIAKLFKQLKEQYNARAEKTRSDYFSPFLR